MTTLITLADGEKVRTNQDVNGVIDAIARAVNDPPVVSAGPIRRLPTGYFRIRPDRGEEIFVNASQIVSVRPEAAQQPVLDRAV